MPTRKYLPTGQGLGSIWDESVILLSVRICIWVAKFLGFADPFVCGSADTVRLGASSAIN
jgi:hypothetical protein